MFELNQVYEDLLFHTTHCKMVHPLLKWVGGKTQILDKVLARIPRPSEIQGIYHEPFVGGGSVLLAVLVRWEADIGSLDEADGRVMAYDANPWLILLYEVVRDDVDGFLRECDILQGEYDSCSEMKGVRNCATREAALEIGAKESYYYWVRSCFNETRKQVRGERDAVDTVTRARVAAMLVFLNKMGFRGLYREGPRGYNVPFGHYTRARMVDERNVREVSRLLQGANVRFQCCDFRVALGKVCSGDFVYCDPPYVPETTTSFVGYIGNGFSGDDHRCLFEALRGLRDRGAGFLMSNSGVAIVRDAFPMEDGYTVEDVDARRAIHSRDPGARTVEVLIGGTLSL